MIKKFPILLIALLSSLFCNAQSQPDSGFSDSSHLRISLLTCGTGDEIWETFGHTAVRITDSINGLDIVYNYGTFAFGDDFELQFMQGKLLYYVSYYPYESFLAEYTSVKRSVDEQLLVLTGPQKQSLYGFLKNNALEENKYYKYDFFFDNCATRIRDVFPYALGAKFKYGNVLPPKQLSFRNIINQYFYRTHWERFGINILLGSRIDKIMTNADIMFLPDYLRDGIATATLRGKKIAEPVKVIVTGSEKKPAGLNQPLVLTIIIAILTILGLSIKPLDKLGKFMTVFMLVLTGLLGCLIVVMWLGTDHQGCQNNYSLLWALPTNLLLAFANKKNKGKYALVGIGLIIVSLIVHLLKIQELPLLELSPLLLALVFIYGTIYKRGRLKPVHGI